MRSATFARALLWTAVLVSFFAVQFVAADNWGFCSLASDTGAWRDFCYVRLPEPAYAALHHPAGSFLLQPSLFAFNRAWHEVIYDGQRLRSPAALALIRLSEEHNLAFLALVATVNTVVWTALGLFTFRVVQLFRRLPTPPSSRPA